MGYPARRLRSAHITMLFNSYHFIFAFLPFTLIVFWALRERVKYGLLILWLIFCSLFFYAWWNLLYVTLLLVSISFNYYIGQQLTRHQSRLLLAVGIAANLGILAYFKYFNFFAENLSFILDHPYNPAVIVLPLAISFFSFQQIAFLVDTYQNKRKSNTFAEYVLFVCFFPQLIAGPIVHYNEVVPQIKKINSVQTIDLALGLSMFCLGLFKKTVLADGIAPYANPVFDSAAAGADLDFITAWLGVLAYTLQLYFDFSGYSDMAIGLARMFGIVLPVNFDSPYKATSIADFWRRWHITLSRFLKDYLYIPLGGNRRGKLRRYINLFTTMLLGGLWHGANWTFVAWGALHGVYLIIHQLWSSLKQKMICHSQSTVLGLCFARITTFFAVTIGWVFFRAEDLTSAKRILIAMSGQNGVNLPAPIWEKLSGIHPLLSDLGIGAANNSIAIPTLHAVWVMVLLCIVFVMPNSQQVFSHYQVVLGQTPQYSGRISWRPTRRWAITISLLFVLSILALPQFSQFLYFQF